MILAAHTPVNFLGLGSASALWSPLPLYPWPQSLRDVGQPRALPALSTAISNAESILTCYHQ
jgi:hypothetical protein